MHRWLRIFWLAGFPATGAVCTSPVSACILTMHSERRSALRCLYRPAKVTPNLCALKTTDENLTVCTTDSSVPAHGNRASEESTPFRFCAYPVPASLPGDFWQGAHEPDTPRDSNTACCPQVGAFNTANTGSPSPAVQPSYQAAKRGCLGVLKPTTILQPNPPLGRQTSSLHGFSLRCMNLIFNPA